MKITLIIFLVSFLVAGCNPFAEHQIVRKKVKDKNIIVKWYYYSAITSDSPDIIEIQKEDVVKQIYKADESIVNLFLKNDTIIIKTLRPSAGITYTKQIDDSQFNYKIIVDTSGTSEEYMNKPRGEKEY